MDQTTPPTLACHNCKTLTTDNGQEVWVCEKCGEENHAPVIDEQTAQAMIDAAAVTPETPTAMDTQSNPPPSPLKIP